MLASPSSSQPPRRGWMLRKADQAAVATILLLSLVALSGYWLSRGGGRGGLVEFDQAPPQTARFEVDINSADWPELAQLPDLGETLARRIVESRENDGPFHELQDLRRVRGIGPKTLDRMRPYLRAMPELGTVAGP
ncbi:MAG: ComEA family DNA-binding protein [Pirellulales bacterium]